MSTFVTASHFAAGGGIKKENLLWLVTDTAHALRVKVVVREERQRIIYLYIFGEKRAEFFILFRVKFPLFKTKSHAVVICSRKHKAWPLLCYRCREVHTIESSCVAPCRMCIVGSGICACKSCRGIFCHPVDYFGT